METWHSWAGVGWHSQMFKTKNICECNLNCCIIQSLTVFSSCLVCIFKSTLRFKIKLKTYCPSRRAGADSFALTDASILAGAACLASFIAGHLAAGQMTEAKANRKRVCSQIHAF